VITEADNDSWTRLRSSYGTTGIALFLGAGVSCASRLPSWDELVRRLFELKLGAETGGFNILRSAGFSLPTMTEFIKAKTSADVNFLEAVREMLYKDFPCKAVRITNEAEGARQVVAHVESDNATLAAIYNLAVVRNPTGKLVPNPRVLSIVNFNLDSLLEAYDTARNLLNPIRGRRCLHTIENPAATRIFNRTSIYHPHGFLRFDRRAGRQEKEATTSVLSENEYYDFYNRPTALFTYTVLSLLREFCCLFVGMSMTDDNIRRLLFYSKQERDESRRLSGRRAESQPRHYAILQRCNSVAQDFLTTTLLRLSVQPLWVEEFGEIPDRLGQLTKDSLGK
jgi:hypothetical protein